MCELCTDTLDSEELCTGRLSEWKLTNKCKYVEMLNRWTTESEQSCLSAGTFWHSQLQLFQKECDVNFVLMLLLLICFNTVVKTLLDCLYRLSIHVLIIGFCNSSERDEMFRRKYKTFFFVFDFIFYFLGNYEVLILYYFVTHISTTSLL